MTDGNIISEAQAEAVGAALTQGERDKDFVIFWFIHKRSKLTMFGIEILSTERITLRDPR